MVWIPPSSLRPSLQGEKGRSDRWKREEWNGHEKGEGEKGLMMRGVRKRRECDGFDGEEMGVMKMRVGVSWSDKLKINIGG